MADEEQPQIGAYDPTVIESDATAGPSQLDQKLIDAALASGLITEVQAGMVLESLSDAAAGATVTVMVDRGLISKEAAEDLVAKVTDDFIPGYALGQELGRGAMGVVYEATQRKLDRRVALKVVNPALSSDRNYVKRFKREALALAKLNHPNIVQVYDYGEADKKIYLALEFVEGEDCSEIIKREGRFEERQALKLVRGAAMGLSHAQQAGIIHRDIKPANLLLQKGTTDASQDELVAKVTDLGLAREARPAKEDGELTQAGTILGTPAYMAPEQTTGKSEIDYRSDIYALGGTLYHMVTGALPYQDSSVVNILIKKRTERLQDPRKLAPGLSGATVRIIDRMMARAPEDRYQEYAELIADLDAALCGDPLSSKPLDPDASCLMLSSAVHDVLQTEVREAKPGDASAGGSPMPALVAVVALLAVVVLAFQFKKPPAPSGAVTKTGVATKTDAGEPSPKDALAKELDGLAKVDPKQLVYGFDDVHKLYFRVTKLSDAERNPLLLRLRGLITKGLNQTEAKVGQELEELWERGKYREQVVRFERAIRPYAVAKQPFPPRWSDLTQKAGFALKGGAGKRERAAWAKVEAEWAKGPQRDYLQLLGWLQSFNKDFGTFSPEAVEARRRLRVAEKRAPLLRLRVFPKQARLFLGERELGRGSWSGRVQAGAHTVRVRAPGHFGLEQRLQIKGPTTRTLYLAPRPKQELEQDPTLGPRRPFFNPVGRSFYRDWQLSGEWVPVPAQSGMLGTAKAGGGFSTVSRTFTKLLSRIRAAKAPGWSVSFEMSVKEQASGRGGYNFQVRFLHGPNNERIGFGLHAGGFELRVRSGGKQRVVRRQKIHGPIPKVFRVDWDGQVAMVFVGTKFFHSVRPAWTPVERVEFAVGQGKVLVRDLRLLGLRVKK